MSGEQGALLGRLTQARLRKDCDEAERALAEATARGVVITVPIFNVAMRVFANGRRWEAALDYLDLMRRAGLKPNVLTYNWVLRACASGGQASKASEVLREMAATVGVKPNVFSYTCLLYTSPSPRDLSTSRMPSSA